MYKQALLCVVVFFALVSYANAVFVPFTIDAQLTGDPRLENPDGMVVDVSIVVDSETTANWTVDLSANATDHPDIKLGEFYFNFASPGGTITFDNFNPLYWAVIAPSSTVGGGNIAFTFEASDPPGQPQADEVNVSQALTFDMNTSFTLMEEYFFDADKSCSSEEELGCGQLGAHVQSLELTGGSTTDSGFVMGDYDGTGTPDEVIPEPSTLILLGVGLVGLAAYRRKKH